MRVMDAVKETIADVSSASPSSERMAIARQVATIRAKTVVALAI